MEGLADGIPVVGHVKGIVHYATGDQTKGDNCMKAASKSTLVLAVGVATVVWVEVQQQLLWQV